MDKVNADHFDLNQHYDTHGVEYLRRQHLTEENSVVDSHMHLHFWGAVNYPQTREIANMQWTQLRCFLAKLALHDRCVLCLDDAGASISEDGIPCGDWEAVPRGDDLHRVMHCPRHETERKAWAPETLLEDRRNGKLRNSSSTTRGLMSADLVMSFPPIG